MKTAPVVPAALAFDSEGVPFCSAYSDRYHPRSGALAQARHVFIAGNGMPERWRRRERFVVLETGFGLGNNFLATWDAWRSDPQRCERLHFISIEKHPLTQGDLARAHATSPLPDLADQLVQAWPPLTPNLHHLAFEGGRVQLLLALGDVAQWLPEIVASVDAFYLDGFAPDRNPAMWQARVFKAIGRIAAPGATAATWSAARAVRLGLEAAGFEVRSAPGSGEKRDITLARFAPAFTPRRAPARPGTPPATERHALVVGAGLAGCALAWALADQGWRSTLLDRLPQICGAASGNRAGIFHGVVHPQDGAHARFNRAAALQARIAVSTAVAEHGAPGQVCGVLRIETSTALAAVQAQLATLGLPPDYVDALAPEQVSRLSGLPADTPAWFYPGGGWVRPSALADSFLQRAGNATNFRAAVHVAALRRASGQWQLLGDDGQVLAEATVVILANAVDAARLLGAGPWPLQAVRGQTTELPASTPRLHLPRLPMAGSGYVLPPLAGDMALFGATAQRGDMDPRLRAEDHLHNLAQLARLTGSAPEVDPGALSGRVGWRCVAEDRLPVLGAVPDTLAPASPGQRLDQPRLVPRAPGLFVLTGLASRGITWAALGAQAVASWVSGAPCPLEASLLDAVDAARFVSRAARRG